MTLALLVHQISVFLSIIGFFARGLGHIFEMSWINGKAAKVLPHIIDTALLISALTLLALGPWGVSDHWIQIKIAGLVLYILLGLMAFRFAKTRLQKALYWMLALAVIFYLVAVSKTHSVLPFMSV